MEIFLLALGMFLAGLIAGVFVGYKLENKEQDGTVYLEMSEEGAERIRWYLGMEYDDIRKHRRLVFNVVNKMPDK